MDDGTAEAPFCMFYLFGYFRTPRMCVQLFVHRASNITSSGMKSRWIHYVCTAISLPYLVAAHCHPDHIEYDIKIVLM